jgi:hypothetical protein
MQNTDFKRKNKSNKRMIKKHIKTDEFLQSQLNIEKTMEKFKNSYKDIDTLLNSSVKSQKLAIWKCSKGHEWEDRITNVNNHRECPFCSGKYLLAGVNDLQTINPELAKEWHPTLNNNLVPSMISFRSETSVFWLCNNGHAWKSKVRRRIDGAACPQCMKKENYDLIIYIIYYYIKKYINEVVLNYRNKDVIKNYKISIYVPSLRIGIEYDKDLGLEANFSAINKNEICRANGIKLIRIRDVSLTKTKLHSSSIDYQRNDNKYDSLEITIKKILYNHFNIIDPDIEIKRDLEEIYYLKNCPQVTSNDTASEPLNKKVYKMNNITSTNQRLSKEWNKRKNDKLKPYMFSKYSRKKVWWKCTNCKHEWQEEIYKRANKKNLICPLCSVH